MLTAAGGVRLEATWLGLGSECGKGIFVLRRTCTILGRAEVPLPGILPLREEAIQQSCDCSHNNALLTQW